VISCLPVTGQLTVPNILTVVRMVLAAVAAGLALEERTRAHAVALLVIAALLDVFDGWYARAFAQGSRLGKHLDPFADKVLTAVVYAWIGADAGSVLVWSAIAVVMAREAAVTGLRAHSLRRHGRYIPAGPLGRLKMFLQCATGLTILGTAHWLGRPTPVAVVTASVAVVAAVSYASAIVYFRDWKQAAYTPVASSRGAPDRIGRLASGG